MVVCTYFNGLSYVLKTSTVEEGCWFTGEGGVEDRHNMEESCMEFCNGK